MWPKPKKQKTFNIDELKVHFAEILENILLKPVFYAQKNKRKDWEFQQIFENSKIKNMEIYYEPQKRIQRE